MTQEQAHHSRALDSFAVFALGITFILRYAHFLTAHQLFGPFVDNVHMHGPIFSEVSRLALAGELQTNRVHRLDSLKASSNFATIT